MLQLPLILRDNGLLWARALESNRSGYEKTSLCVVRSVLTYRLSQNVYIQGHQDGSAGEVPGGKPEDLFHPWTLRWTERTDARKLSSDLHTRTGAGALAYLPRG